MEKVHMCAHTHTQGQGGEGDSGQETGVRDRWIRTHFSSEYRSFSSSGLEVKILHNYPLLCGLDLVKDRQNALRAFLPSVLAMLLPTPGRSLRPDLLSQPQPPPTTSSLRSSNTWSLTSLPGASALPAPFLEGSSSRLCEVDPLQVFAQNHLLMVTLHEPPT